MRTFKTKEELFDYLDDLVCDIKQTVLSMHGDVKSYEVHSSISIYAEWTKKKRERVSNNLKAYQDRRN